MPAARISSVSNPVVKAARRLARRPPRGSRDLLVEGPQAVSEAVPFLRRVLLTASARQRHPDLTARLEAAGVDLLECTEDVLAAVAGTITPQGLVGVGTLPGASLEAVLPHATLLVVLVDVRDPGNLGTVMRTADAAGADAVVLVGDCVDPRNSKVVRASAGSLFHLPVVESVSFDDLVRGCGAAGLALVAADAEGADSYTEVDLRCPSALVFGNEAHGLDTTVRGACDRIARVPMTAPARPGWSGAAESLNLAATVAVMTFEAARQRRSGGHQAGPRGTPGTGADEEGGP